VLNVVTGFGPTAGAAIASHMDIDKVSLLSVIFYLFRVVYVILILGIMKMKKIILYCINKVKHMPFMMIGQFHWVNRGWSACHGGSREK
jgi:hypothetical protein